MSKVKKEKTSIANRHNPLDKEILASRFAHPSSRQKTRGKVPKDDKFIDNRLTSEILKQARKQQEELEEEHGFSVLDKVSHSSLNSSSLSESGDNDDEQEEYVFSKCEEEKHFQEISEEEAKAFESFMSTNLEKRETLADIIKDTLTEKKTEICTVYSDAGTDVLDRNEKFFKDLAPNLKNYRSGKLPKGFKAIPCSGDGWERLLYLTKPDEWSSAAMYQATRIFASNLEGRKAQRFFNKILLPRCRDEIAEHHALNTHTYNALKKALFKPAAFFKGIIIPLCKSKCTLREASIFASVLAKFSIPVLHSSAALLSVATAEYQGANIIIMRTLIEKKYALPYRVVNAVVDYFLGFMKYSGTTPVLWYQCLLSFVQIYKLDLSTEQRADLLKLLTIHNHEKITPEIRRELSEIRKELDDTAGLPNVLQHVWRL